MNTDVLTWPPVYVLRRSKRVKSIQLNITPHKGLEIVLPYRQSLAFVEDILIKHRLWIEKVWQRVRPISSLENLELPKTIHLRAMDKLFEVFFIDHNKKIKLHEEEGALYIYGPLKDMAEKKPFWAKSLQDWTLSKGKGYLFSYLKELSDRTGLVFNQCSLRKQTTLWGSCTSLGRISLNYKLMFLPPVFVEYVLLHELCHTRYLDHSKSFWDLLESFNPGCLKTRQQLRQADHYLPAWSIPIF